MKAVLIVAAVAVPTPVLAQVSEWHIALTAQDIGQNSAMLIDAKSVTSPTATTREAWTSNIFAQVQKLQDGRSFDELRMKYRFDCTAGTASRIISSVWLENKLVLEEATPSEPAVYEAGTRMWKAAYGACTSNYATLPLIEAATPHAEARRRFTR